MTTNVLSIPVCSTRQGGDGALPSCASGHPKKSMRKTRSYREKQDHQALNSCWSQHSDPASPSLRAQPGTLLLKHTLRTCCGKTPHTDLWLELRRSPTGSGTEATCSEQTSMASPPDCSLSSPEASADACTGDPGVAGLWRQRVSGGSCGPAFPHRQTDHKNTAFSCKNIF